VAPPRHRQTERDTQTYGDVQIDTLTDLRHTDVTRFILMTGSVVSFLPSISRLQIISAPKQIGYGYVRLQLQTIVQKIR